MARTSGTHRLLTRLSVLVGTVVLMLLISACGDRPELDEESLSVLFDDSVASVSTLLGERDHAASERFEWHAAEDKHCGLARYARWPLADNDQGDLALLLVYAHGEDAGLRMFNWSDDAADEYSGRVLDMYGSPFESHLYASSQDAHQHGLGSAIFAFGLDEAPPVTDHGWFEIVVCSR